MGGHLTAYRLPLLPGLSRRCTSSPAASLIDMAVAIGEGGLAAEALGRLGVDALSILVAGLIVPTFKERVTHRRGCRVAETAGDGA